MSDDTEFARLLEEIAAAPAEVPRGLEAELPRMLGRYRLLERLGEGGMGVVYRAVDDVLRREVAVKLPGARYRGLARRRLLNEARRAAAFDHPNIAKVYDAGEIAGEAFIALEYVRGETLRAAIRRGPLAESTAFGLLLSIARALAHTHERGIVHRDLKPENVMVDVTGGVKVLDFGLAQPASALEGGPTAEDATSSAAAGDAAGVAALGVAAAAARDVLAHALTVHAGEASSSSPASAGSSSQGSMGWELRAGTPGYMSPEQQGSGAVGAAADVFAFGVIAHELLTGQAPGADAGTGSWPRLAWRPATRSFVQACLATSERERPRDGAALVAALQALQGGSRVRRVLRRSLVPLLAALLASAVVSLRLSSRAPSLENAKPAFPGANGSRPGRFTHTDEYTEHQSFLAPSGQKLAFVDARGLMLFDLNSGERRRLLPPAAGVAQAHWLPEERELVLLIDAGRVPAKLERFELASGRRTPLAATVSSNFTLARDGQRFASVVHEGVIEIATLDASAPVQTLAAPGALPASPLAWSPDDDWIAVNDARRTPPALVAVHTVSGERRVLVEHAGLIAPDVEAVFTWQANGQLSWQQIEGEKGSLWTAKVDPQSLKLSGVRRISGEFAIAMWLQGNDAGDRLVLHERRARVGVLRARVLANGRLEEPLATPTRRNVDQFVAGWQPGQLGLLTTLDGKVRPALTSLEDGSFAPWLEPGDLPGPWMALGEREFLFYRPAPDGTSQLWRQPGAAGAAAERLPDFPASTRRDAIHCAWRAQRCFLARPGGGAWRIAELALPRGALRETFAVTGTDQDPLAVSPDAQRWVAGRESTYDGSVRFFDARGKLTARVQLPATCYPETMAFAPDGSSAYAAAWCLGHERYHIFLVSPAGQVERLWKGPGWVDKLTLSPDRQWLAFDQRTLEHEILTLDVPGEPASR